ncbi:MAG TPA: DNA polymerase IV [Candidatus Acidoferrales bacterium]|nr:DNA polymerase IV [Candidatus Acidoferrales bacterium]
MSPSVVGRGRPHVDEPGERQAILHCDLDAFYASVEQRDHPEYRGKPVIVGGAKGERGVVSAASYEARAFGVRSAMPLQTATRLCPDGIFVPGDPEAYEKASDDVMALFAERTPLVEPISLDEAFLDVTATEHLFGGAERIARDLKRDARAKCGLVLSVGVATNKLCAKVGSDLRKPDGLVIVPAGTEAAFLAPLELARLWGVGPKTRELLEGWGMRTIGDLARADIAMLDARLGEHGRAIWERANGIDEGTVEPYMSPKSVGHEHTFDRNTLDTTKIESMLLRLSEHVGTRLRAQELRGRTITLKLRVEPFETRSRQRTVATGTDDDLTIYRVSRQLLRDALAEDRTNGRASPVRLIGVSVSGLEAGRQLGLFDHARVARLNAALDAVRSKFGSEALDRVSARDVKERRRFSGQRTRRES